MFHYFIIALVSFLTFFNGTVFPVPLTPIMKRIPSDPVLLETNGHYIHTLAEGDAKKIIESRAQATIQALKNKNWNILANIVHPTMGVRFSPNTLVTGEQTAWTKEQIRGLGTNLQTYHWSICCGLDQLLTLEQYLARIAFNHDFTEAKSVSYNRQIANALDINNVTAAYPDAIVVEYYLSGSEIDMTPGIPDEEKSSQWKSLRLVFQKYGELWYLVGIINDQVTI